MNITFSLQRKSKTDSLGSNLISRQLKLNLMAMFLQNKLENPALKKIEIANQLGYSRSTLQRFGNDIKVLSPYRIQPNNANKRTKELSNTNFDKNSHCEHDVKRLQLTSNSLAKSETNTKSNKKNKNVLKSGSLLENVETNAEYLDEILFIKNL